MRLPPTDMTRPLHLPPSSTPIRRISADCKKTRFRLETVVAFETWQPHYKFQSLSTTDLLPPDFSTLGPQKQCRIERVKERVFFSSLEKVHYCFRRVEFGEVCLLHIFEPKLHCTAIHQLRGGKVSSLLNSFISGPSYGSLLYTACKSLFLISPLPALSL